MTVELTIDSLAAGGDGVGRTAEGRVTFVPRTAPGDRVAVRLVQTKKRFARAELERILEPSPSRVEPPCPHFGQGCGGCQWLHVSADAQLRAKQEIVASALRRPIERGMQLAPIEAPVTPLGWRRRARWHWVRRNRGQVVLGFFGRRSQRVVDTEHCPQLEPGLEAGLAAAREALAPALAGRGELRAVVGSDGAVHMDVDGPCPVDAAQALVGRGPVVGVSLGDRTMGRAGVDLEPGLRTGAIDFAQASAMGNRALLDTVDAATSPRRGLRILELYAGAGNLTRVLRKDAGEVVACELQLAERRATSDRGVGEAPVVWSVGDVAQKLDELVAFDEDFDLVVVDPPRTGAGSAVPGLIALAPPRIVYVSCDPATLARDIEGLYAGGYRAERAQPLDLMPQTAHVEVVVTLVREHQGRDEKPA